ncbi:hypothetical protein BC834DRAFT_843146 [Gloeopeniophorella convolvens]|nr:hypothetical protein BC834DRAFT_843146 [Gloeopeniophorella convolvens]
MDIRQHNDTPPLSPRLDPSASSIPTIFDSALKQYTAKTGVDLATHAPTAKLGRCNTVDAVIDVFQDQLYLLKLYRNRRGRRAKVLEAAKPVVDAVLSLYDSGILDQCLASVFPPAQAIFSGIGILLQLMNDQTTRKVGENYDTLVGLFDSIKTFLDRLKVYDQAPLPFTISEVIAKVFAEMISIIALATKEIEQGSLKKFGKALLGHKAIQDALERMNKLTQEESRAVVAETYGNAVAIKASIQQTLSIGVTICRSSHALDILHWKPTAKPLP